MKVGVLHVVFQASTRQQYYEYVRVTVSAITNPLVGELPVSIHKLLTRNCTHNYSLCYSPGFEHVKKCGNWKYYSNIFQGTHYMDDINLKPFATNWQILTRTHDICNLFVNVLQEIVSFMQEFSTCCEQLQVCLQSDCNLSENLTFLQNSSFRSGPPRVRHFILFLELRITFSSKIAIYPLTSKITIPVTLLLFY